MKKNRKKQLVFLPLVPRYIEFVKFMLSIPAQQKNNI